MFSDNADPYFIETPSDTSAGEGCPSAQLNCTVDNASGTMYWIFKGSNLYINDIPQHPRLYDLETDLTEGEYHLVILDIDDFDVGEYECQHNHPLLQAHAELSIECKVFAFFTERVILLYFLALDIMRYSNFPIHRKTSLRMYK